MRIFFSGIGGVGIGPLAEIAHQAGADVVGSDRSPSLMTTELQEQHISIEIGEQTGDFLQAEHGRQPFDYFVYTSALKPDHPELVIAHRLGIPTMKRDGMIARILALKNQKLIAVAGTHGKTTTTGMIIWAAQQLGIAMSHSIGTNLSFAPSGVFNEKSDFFVYEADEFDRNFLHFTPYISVITSIDYDHPDTYPTRHDYLRAFNDFIENSQQTILWQHDATELGANDSSLQVIADSVALEHLDLSGTYLRKNAFLVERALLTLFPELHYHDVIAALNSFPGTVRRFEKLSENIYSDYAHHPTEIAATVQRASEISDAVVVVYQPHQNRRQHELLHEYGNCFEGVQKVYWLPTYLSREDETFDILTPEQLISQIPNNNIFEPSQMDDTLWKKITAHQAAGDMVLAMSAGDLDEWLRNHVRS